MSTMFVFEVGKLYVRRDGEIVECSRVFKGNGAEFLTKDKFYFYVWSNGQVSNHTISHKDIIQPYMSTKIIDITKPVQTVGGKPVTQLIKFEGVQTEFPLFGVLDGTVITWAVDGRIGSIAGSINDIINVPEKKVVPLEFGDIMPGDLFKWEGSEAIFSVVQVSENRVVFCAHSSVVSYRYDALIGNAQYSQDRGKTWKPCSKEIEV